MDDLCFQIAMRYHTRVISEWRQNNQDVHILDTRAAVSSPSVSLSSPTFSQNISYSASSSDNGLTSPASNNIIDSNLSTDTDDVGTLWDQETSSDVFSPFPVPLYSELFTSEYLPNSEFTIQDNNGNTLDFTSETSHQSS